jgi:hypothetical protein
LIVICSRNPNNYLIENVTNLKKFYPDNKIIIIDSDSTDLTSYKIVKEKFNDIEIHYVKNKNYPYGAWKIAYNLYPNYETYMCIQDSLICTKKITIKKDILYLRKWIMPLSGIQR